jgi:hypothetical protein
MNFRSLTAGTVVAALAAVSLIATPTRAQAPTPIRAACATAGVRPADLLHCRGERDRGSMVTKAG